MLEQWRARAQRARHGCAFGAFAISVLLIASSTALADDFGSLSPLELRGSAAAALMLSRDQRSWLAYQAPGALADAALAYRPNAWFDLQIGAVAGVFFSSASAGTLLAPLLGLGLRAESKLWRPHGTLAGGVAFTGKLVRPFARALFGVDVPLDTQWRIGPVVGLDVVTQRDGARHSTDAMYAWLGVSVSCQLTSPPSAARSVRPPPAAVLPPPRADPVVRADEASPAAAPLEPLSSATQPSAELSHLLDTAVGTTRTELLAPVLFQYDSVELEPSSVAMLHQVAQVLDQRRDFERVQVIAYADARGTAAYNEALAQRRAAAVLEWLVAHGVARERLETSAPGAVDFAEDGSSEQAHQQNRRVIFRVRRMRPVTPAQEQP